MNDIHLPVTVKYRKIPKIRPGLIFGGAYIRRGLCTEGNLRLKIDWASLILGRKFTVFLWFTLYLRAISMYKPPGGGYLEGRFNGGFFAFNRSLGGLYLEGLIQRRDLFSEFYGMALRTPRYNGQQLIPRRKQITDI